MTIDQQAEAALRRLRHSIATSAGMHKLQIRRRAQRMRAEQWQPYIRIAMPNRYVLRGTPCTPPPPKSPPSA